jgi:hypothetical protein
MTNDFEIVAGFLERFGGEAEGRELPEPPAEIRNQLRDLARGHLTQPQCAELLALLSRNPGWISHLAYEVKTLRPPEAPRARSVD